MPRTHPIATRVGSLINWAQDVRHPPLSRLVKQIFKDRVISKPFVKASVNSIWIDVTVYNSNKNEGANVTQSTHVLQFDSLNIAKCFGEVEDKVQKILTNDKHYSRLKELQLHDNQIGKKLPGYIFKDEKVLDNYKLMGIHDKRPIYLRVNSVTCPFLDAQVGAHYFARKLGQKVHAKSIVEDVKTFVNLNITE